ncbi:hypothetical protein [Methyloprofundus sp.]|uniref:hypothetical protein n=1 Tax=Methyloprofundus sp. TaxID=2020875 RepID=UPI003D096415
MPKDLSAQLHVSRPPDEELTMGGGVVDLSYSGIKIKLNSPLVAKVKDKVTMNQ